MNRASDEFTSMVSMNLRRMMIMRSLDVCGLATKAGVSVTTVMAHRNGLQLPRLDVLCRYADALKTSIDYLCGRTEEP